MVVLGGTAAVSEAAAAGLGATRRVEGAERTATTAAIAQELRLASGRGQGGALLVNVRAADGWPAALTVAVPSALLDAPQLGVEAPPAAIGDAVAVYLAQQAPTVLAFGSARLVSDAQLQEALAARG